MCVCVLYANRASVVVKLASNQKNGKSVREVAIKVEVDLWAPVNGWQGV